MGTKYTVVGIQRPSGEPFVVSVESWPGESIGEAAARTLLFDNALTSESYSLLVAFPGHLKPIYLSNGSNGLGVGTSL